MLPPPRSVYSYHLLIDHGLAPSPSPCHPPSPPLSLHESGPSQWLPSLLQLFLSRQLEALPPHQPADVAVAQLAPEGGVPGGRQAGGAVEFEDSPAWAQASNDRPLCFQALVLPGRSKVGGEGVD